MFYIPLFMKFTNLYFCIFGVRLRLTIVLNLCRYIDIFIDIFAFFFAFDINIFIISYKT